MVWVDDCTIEVFKVFLAFAGVHSHGKTVWPNGSIQGGVLIHVLHQQGRADGRAIVDSGASVAMPACPAHTNKRK